MDKGKDYILMCEKAEEIQKLRGDNLWQEGDFYTDDIQRRRDMVSSWNDQEDEPMKMYNPVWLIRQDQSQDIMKLVVEGQSGFEVSAALLEKFNKFQWNGFFRSMEQMWLHFTMEQKFRKIWNGKEWLKII